MAGVRVIGERQHRKFESKPGDDAHSKERPSRYRLLNLSVEGTVNAAARTTEKLSRHMEFAGDNL
jgi:hypothetical protein